MHHLHDNPQKSADTWGFRMSAQAQPPLALQHAGATSLNIQIQLPSHLTQKRAWTWALFALLSGTIGYQIALSHHAPIGSEASGLITRTAFIPEANASVERMPKLDTTLKMASLPMTHPDFSLHLDRTLNTLPVAAVNDSNKTGAIQLARELPASTQSVRLAQLSPPTATAPTTVDTAASELRLPEDASGAFSASSAAKPNAQALLDSPAKPQMEAKVHISKHMSADQQAIYYYQQAIAFLQQGRVAEAQDMLKKTLDTYPAHEDARQTLVGLLVDNHHADEAMPVLKAGLALAPKNVNFTQTLARLQLDAGLAEEALNTLQAGASEANDAAEYQALLAVVQQKLNHHDAAVTHFQLALNQAANSPTLLIGLGVSLQMLGRNQEAKASFLQAQQTELNQELALFVAERIKQVQ